MRLRHPIIALALLVSAGAAESAPAHPEAGAATAAPPLDGATPAQVKARLGEPAVASQEGRGALWTYRLEACALMIFFKDDGEGLKVSGVTAAGRRRGEASPSVAACLATTIAS